MREFSNMSYGFSYHIFLFLHRRQMPNPFSAHLFSTPQHITYNHLHSMIVHANQSQHSIKHQHNTKCHRHVMLHLTKAHKERTVLLVLTRCGLIATSRALERYIKCFARHWWKPRHGTRSSCCWRVTYEALPPNNRGLQPWFTPLPPFLYPPNNHIKFSNQFFHFLFLFLSKHTTFSNSITSRVKLLLIFINFVRNSHMPRLITGRIRTL
jgi:hypothetical protein